MPRAEDGEQWWKDTKSKYNEFASQYQDLKAVKKAREAERGDGRINVLKWEL